MRVWDLRTNRSRVIIIVPLQALKFWTFLSLYLVDSVVARGGSSIVADVYVISGDSSGELLSSIPRGTIPHHDLGTLNPGSTDIFLHLTLGTSSLMGRELGREKYGGRKCEEKHLRRHLNGRGNGRKERE
ncbi:hypothetical protein BV22DRAFT_1050671 [Leucogyrophana mollusca]|uniref:Uncharacterized protein n=1 Tax=Leucogyrophana mollusca TaxID=85980 RepID=A0ACB8B435_9AGAM|nr:hypothetical protein BV22DRAFT_1050671 [Leucogyrophana mollusca]